MPDMLSNITENTIQEHVRDEPRVSGVSLFTWLAGANNIIPVWWSRERDVALDAFWRKSDHLSGALFAMDTKLTTIPLRIVPRDMSIKSHFPIADSFTDALYNWSEFGNGWISFFGKWVRDYYSFDNGAFAEIVADGKQDEEITGRAYAINHLDSLRCTRTNSPEFPVVYTDTHSVQHKLHYTRVIYGSQMPSGDARMNNVGLCAISRAINAGQNLLDIAIYKQEKLGSRPNRQMMITQGGLDPEDVQLAINMANQSMDMQGLSRYAKTIVLGSANMPNADIKAIDSSSLPDGFDEEESTILGMAIIALAFGTDVRELFPITMSGATKADAVIQHIKQRGKGAGHTLQLMENMLNQKFLPAFLKAEFDFQDDAQDRQSAEIASVRAQSRERDINAMVIDLRTARELMVKSGELTGEQFEQLELNDGRLEDGTSVEMLFYSKDKEYVEFLSGEGSEEDKRITLMEVISTSRDVERVKKARRALAAIDFRVKEKEEEESDKRAEQLAVQRPNKINDNRNDDSYDEEKFGRKLPTQVDTLPDEEENYTKELDMGQDIRIKLVQKEQPAPIVNVTVPETVVNITIPKDAIKVEVPESKVVVNVPKQDIVVNVPEQKQPQIKMYPKFTVTMPENKEPVKVENVESPSRSYKIKRDASGKMTEIVATDKDGAK